MMNRRLVLASILLASTACDDSTGPEPGKDLAADIVYERVTEAGPQLVALSLDGTAPVPVLPAGTRGMHAAMSPDMLSMLFVQDEPVTTGREVWVVGRSGLGAVQLTDHPEIDDSPVWAPDGERIAFRSWRSERAGEIWTMRRDGTDLRNLTPALGPWLIDYRHPSWAPSGELIAYSSDEGGNRDIWVMRSSDGTERRQLTASVDTDDDPAWSPDGSTILFTRSSPDGTYIMAIPAAVGTAVRLTHGGHATMPAWSPDGTMIAFTRRDTPTGRPQIYTMRADGTDVRLRTVDPAWGGGQNPAWRRVPGEG